MVGRHVWSPFQIVVKGILNEEFERSHCRNQFIKLCLCCSKDDLTDNLFGNLWFPESLWCALANNFKCVGTLWENHRCNDIIESRWQMLDRHGYCLAIYIKSGIASLSIYKPFLYHLCSMFSMDIPLLMETVILSGSVVGHVLYKANVFLVAKGRVKHNIYYIAEFLVSIISWTRNILGKLSQMSYFSIISWEQ